MLSSLYSGEDIISVFTCKDVTMAISFKALYDLLNIRLLTYGGQLPNLSSRLCQLIYKSVKTTAHCLLNSSFIANAGKYFVIPRNLLIAGDIK